MYVCIDTARDLIWRTKHGWLAALSSSFLQKVICERLLQNCEARKGRRGSYRKRRRGQSWSFSWTREKVVYPTISQRAICGHQPLNCLGLYIYLCMCEIITYCLETTRKMQILLLTTSYISARKTS